MKRKLSEVESNTVGISSVCDDDDDLINLTDTEAAISAVIQSEDGAQLCKGALIHQLYAILSNKTDVDNEILNLRSSKGIKLLHFNLAGTAVTTKSHFVMLHADYSADLRNLLETAPEGSSLRSSLIRFIPLAMKYSDKLSILESDLLSAGNGLSSTADSSKGRVLSSALPTFSSTLVSLSAIDIQTIVGTGFLCKRRDIDTDTSNVLWFSHPILGKLAQWIELSRKQIMGYIRGTRYKELSDRELKKKATGLSSPLGLQFHLYDLIGAGLVHTIKGPRGSTVYRLAVKKDDT